MARKVKKKVNILHIIVLIVALILGLFNLDKIDNGNGEFNVIYGEIENVSISPKVEFCQNGDCYSIFEEVLLNSKSEVKCAFYELDYFELGDLLVEIAESGVYVTLVIDYDYKDEIIMDKILESDINVYFDDRSKFMHNKFCIMDLKYVLTGSMNPTLNGFEYNDNNIVFFESQLLAENYEREFDQLTSGKFGSSKSNSIKFNNITLNAGNEKIRVNNYFCPINDCEGEVLKILDLANEEILFASFVFTNNEMENMLLEKSLNGVDVKGVVESRMWNSLGSRLDELNESFEIIKDKNPKTMHHKFFVIDNRYVITGSMNPSGSGVKYNDENVLIIDSERIAKEFKDEFYRLNE